MWPVILYVTLLAQAGQSSKDLTDYAVDTVEDAVARQQRAIYGELVDSIDTLLNVAPIGQPNLPSEVSQMAVGKDAGQLRLRVLIASGRNVEPYLLVDELPALHYRPQIIRVQDPKPPDGHAPSEPLFPRTVRISGVDIASALGALSPCSLEFGEWIAPTQFEILACGVSVQIERQPDGNYRIQYSGGI